MEFKTSNYSRRSASPPQCASSPEAVAPVMATPHSPMRKRIVVSGIIAAVIAAALVGIFVIIPRDITTPTYQTLTPGGRPITSFGGWHRVSPPGNSPVFMYADTIGGIQISVSEQPLPSTFSTDTNSSVATLAEQYNATDKIDARDTIVYVGTSSKGPQSAIFTKHGLLILIKSRSAIERPAWANYVDSLQ